MVSMTTEGARRLGRAVLDRRTQLGMAQHDLAHYGGPSQVTVRQIEAAKIPNPQTLTLSRLDTALDWQPGTAGRILRGEDGHGVVHELRPAPAIGGVMSRDEANQLLQAIEDDPWLLPEAKEHLAHQYALLLRVGSEDRRDTLRPAAREKRYRTASHARPRAVDPVAEAEVLEDVERAAAENPNGPRGRQRKR